MSEKLSIVIPVYNEGPTVENILDKVKAVQLIQGIDKELIIVNDASTDNTVEVIENYRSRNADVEINFFSHEKNKGKGAALHTGIKQAQGDYIVIQDADLEYDPNELKDLLQPFKNNLGYSFVF